MKKGISVQIDDCSLTIILNQSIHRLLEKLVVQAALVDGAAASGDPH